MIFIVCNSLRNSRIYCCKRAYCKNAPQVLTKIIQYNSSYSLVQSFLMRSPYLELTFWCTAQIFAKPFKRWNGVSDFTSKSAVNLVLFNDYAASMGMQSMSDQFSIRLSGKS